MVRVSGGRSARLLAAVTSILLALVFVSGASAATPVVKNAKPIFTTMGGASPLPTDNTVPHWFGSFTDPTNGVTYGYNMVGSGDPRTTQSTTTIPTVIIPLNFTFSTGQSFNGSDTVGATVASPVFQDNSYAKVRVTPNGQPQTLSAAGTTQLEDATMRSQFDQVGQSKYHLLLDQPNVLPAQTLTVPANQGVVVSFGPGFNTFGDVNYSWFGSHMGSLMNSLHLSPGTLPIFLTNNVYLYEGNNYQNCCVLGYHGATSSANGNGSQNVQTYIYAAYAQPGTWSTSSTPASPDGSDDYYIQDIHALSHEVSEWADDPFVDNSVDPWLTPTAPQYGCSNLLETGDPVVGIGVLLGENPYFQSAGANADGYWHPEDEAFLPWFARQSPNTTSEPIQGGTDGRYTFFGDLNPYPGFQQPATGC
jgi:hypothetical protein